jgi:hypothetical protein
MPTYTMKFLWGGQRINFDEDWDNGLREFGPTTYGKESKDVAVPLSHYPTPGRAFDEEAFDLAAYDLEEAKREAWRRWNEHPYGSEVEGYVIQETGAALPDSCVHRFMVGWDTEPETSG